MSNLPPILNMSAEQRATCLRPLLDLASDALRSTQGNAQRADLYEAVAVATASADTTICVAAWTAAQAIRDAEASQLNFAALLNGQAQDQAA